VTASELAKTQFDHGVDVTYHVAGGSGIGVLQAAADAGKLGIGEDSNQDYLQPGHVLTSMVRRIDLVVYDAFKDMHDGHWSNGIRVYGLKENGVGYTYDQYNKPLISDQMHAKADDAKQKIISGDIKVHSYLTDNACPL
jgi:basic membrane protein A